MIRQVTFSFCILVTLVSFTAAATVYDESVSGDASSDAANPTSITLAPGSNVVSGSVTRSNDLTSGDIDFFSFTISPGMELAGLFLEDYSPNDRGFHAINAGLTGIVPSGPNAGDTSQYLGSAHLDGVPATENLLVDLGTPLAGTGFTGSLGPGDYTYIIQQTGPVLSSYSLDFSVVPEPSGITLLLAAGLMLGVLCRKR